MLPAWSACLWVRITWPTWPQSSPPAVMAWWIAPSLPATPVSTMTASPARTRTYAETKPRFARCHVTPPAADEGGAPAEPPDAPADPADEPPPAADAPAVDADGPPELSAVGPQPATLSTASAMVPRLAWTRNERRLRSIAYVIVGRWYDGRPTPDPPHARTRGPVPLATRRRRPYDATTLRSHVRG